MATTTTASQRKAVARTAKNRWQNHTLPADETLIAATPADEMMSLPLEQIAPSPTNPRKFFDENELRELADSIATHGILQPILVRVSTASGNGKLYELIAGERRWRAAQLVGLATIPAVVRQVEDGAAKAMQIIENLQRRDISPLEEAHGFRALMDDGQTAAEIATQVGKSPRYVWQTVSLVNLPEQAQTDLAEGILNRSAALEIATLPSAKLREQAVKEFKQWNGYLPVARLRERIEEEYRVELKGAPFSKSDATLVPEAGACSQCPKLTGNNRELYPAGRADICTDPPCFQVKIKAHDARALKVYTDAGRSVISGKRADQVFYQRGDEVDFTWQGKQEWALADAPCERDKQSRTWRALLADQLEPTVLQNSVGDIIEAYRMEDCWQLLKSAGVKPPKAKPAETKSSNKDWDKLPKDEAEHLTKLRKRTVSLALEAFRGALAKQVKGFPNNTGLRATLVQLVAYVDDNAFWGRESVFAELYGGSIVEQSQREELNAGDVFSALLEAVICEELKAWVQPTVNRDRAERPKSLLLADVDWEALEQQAAKDLEAEGEHAS